MTATQSSSHTLRLLRALRRASLIAPLASVAWLSCAAQLSKPADAKCKPGAKSAACTGKDAAPSSTNSGSAKPTGSAADFAFPVEDSRHGADAEGTEPAMPANPKGLPEMPTGAVPDPPASSERPMRLPPGGASSSSGPGELPPGTTGASSSRSVEDDDVAPTAAAPDAPVKASALKDLGSRGDTSAARAKLEETRVDDDLKVGRFYMRDGNAQGAYLRFKDAVTHAPDDPEVRFNLAEAALALSKRDEALENYQATLRLDPGGDHDKASRKALGRLGSAAK